MSFFNKLLSKKNGESNKVIKVGDAISDVIVNEKYIEFIRLPSRLITEIKDTGEFIDILKYITRKHNIENLMKIEYYKEENEESVYISYPSLGCFHNIKDNLTKEDIQKILNNFKDGLNKSIEQKNVNFQNMGLESIIKDTMDNFYQEWVNEYLKDNCTFTYQISNTHKDNCKVDIKLMYANKTYQITTFIGKKVDVKDKLMEITKYHILESLERNSTITAKHGIIKVASIDELNEKFNEREIEILLEKALKGDYNLARKLMRLNKLTDKQKEDLIEFWKKPLIQLTEK